jgi:hypothetical protein
MKHRLLVLLSFLCSAFIFAILAMLLNAYPDIGFALCVASLFALFGWLWVLGYRIMSAGTRRPHRHSAHQSVDRMLQ